MNIPFIPTAWVWYLGLVFNGLIMLSVCFDSWTETKKVIRFLINYTSSTGGQVLEGDHAKGEPFASGHPSSHTAWPAGDTQEQQCTAWPDPEMSWSLSWVQESCFPKVIVHLFVCIPLFALSQTQYLKHISLWVFVLVTLAMRSGVFCVKFTINRQLW